MTCQRVVLITGANSGVGYEAIKALIGSEQQYHVLLGSRSADAGETAKEQLQAEVPSSESTIEILQLDIDSDHSIQAAYERIEGSHGRIDVLVNNDGHALDFAAGTNMTVREAFNKMFDTNVSGTHVLTETMAPLLLRSSDPRLLFLTSKLSTFETMAQGPEPWPVPPAGWPKTTRAPSGPETLGPVGYRTSKTAVNMLMLSWHHILSEDKVKVWGVMPGFLITGLGADAESMKKHGAVGPDVGGELIRAVVEGERDSDAGKIVAPEGVQTW
ncbi:Short-chain dehydrogenase/reductase tropE like protein [Verticillium longisporum]|uniref:Short-chain dehydrogenase/reductase tropE like protein n=1 Tax=Verticillium longisporum TaxID=100787 RepID=A0A8I2ZC69_VERLO|nr:Aflatoxin B1 aldehyde reductase member 2 [Verticillium dahliae VDG1]KAG7125479.1 Short-chain dehydrogenase/reductase tropE like protein [Verticillium longisporum]RBQ87492.1 hypothetical protein VDGD_09552 [Verticillium dahliae]